MIFARLQSAAARIIVRLAKSKFNQALPG